MTTTTAVEWGVRHRFSADKETHVDPKQDEAGARRFHHALLYNGHAEAEVVTRISGGTWQPAGEVSRG